MEANKSPARNSSGRGFAVIAELAKSEIKKRLALTQSESSMHLVPLFGCRGSGGHYAAPGASSFVYCGSWMKMHPFGSPLSFSAIGFMS